MNESAKIAREPTRVAPVPPNRAVSGTVQPEKTSEKGEIKRKPVVSTAGAMTSPKGGSKQVILPATLEARKKKKAEKRKRRKLRKSVGKEAITATSPKFVVPGTVLPKQQGPPLQIPLQVQPAEESKLSKRARKNARRQAQKRPEVTGQVLPKIQAQPEYTIQVQRAVKGALLITPPKLSKNAKKKAKRAQQVVAAAANVTPPAQIVAAQPPNVVVQVPQVLKAGPAQESFSVLESRLKGLLVATILTDDEFDQDHPLIKGKFPKIKQTIQEMMKRPEMTTACKEKWWFKMVICSCREKPISVTTPELAPTAKAYGVNWRRTLKVSANTHGLAKLARDIADRLMFDEALQKCESLNIRYILDYFGSLRGWVLWETSTKFASELLGVQPVQWMWYRPLLTTKDHLDYEPYMTKYPSVPDAPGPAFYLIQDIYMPVKELLTDLDRTQCVGAMVGTQLFFRHVLGGIKFSTMPYVQKDGAVRQASALSDHIWPNTFVNDLWITDRSYTPTNKTFMWDTYRKVEDYSLLRVAITTRPVITVSGEQPIDEHSLLEVRTITAQRWKQRAWNWWLKLSWQQPVYNRPLKVFMPAVRKFEGSMVLKTRQNYQVSNLQKEVLEEVNKPGYAGFWELVSETKSEIVLDTVTWLTWGNFENDLLGVESVARLLGPDVSRFKTMKSTMMASWGYAPKIALGVGIVGALAVAMAFKQPSALQIAMSVPYLITKDHIGKMVAKWGKETASIVPSTSQLTTWLKTKAGVVAGMMVAPFGWPYYPLKLMKPLLPERVYNALWWTITTAWGPIQEEFVKSLPGIWGLGATIWIALGETLMIAAAMDWTIVLDPVQFTLGIFLFKFAFHYIVSKLPRPIFFHGLWNMRVFLQHDNFFGLLGSTIATIAGL